MILGRCAAGDWRDEVWWTYALGPGETRTDALRCLYEIFVPALFGHCPRIFPRSRWTGCKESIRDVGLPSAVGGLMEDSFEEYMELVRQPGPRGPVLPLDFRNCDDQPDIADAQPPGDHAIVQYREVPDMGLDQAAEPHKRKANSAEENKANRGKASKWLQGKPRFRMIFIALLLNPLMAFMAKELDMASGEHETQQMHGQLPSSGPLPGRLAGRKWPLLEVAKLTLETQCMQGIVDA
eukprot:7699298-Heterocapsa_arctica.AAC.1